MKVFIVHNATIISPLDAPAGSAWVLGRTLGESIERECSSNGFTIERTGSLKEAEEMARRESCGAFVVADSVACSRSVLRRFVRLAQKRRGPVSVVAALPKALNTNYTSVVDGLDPAVTSSPRQEVWTAPFYFLRGNSSAADAEPLVLPYKEYVIHYALPRGLLKQPEGMLALSDSYLCNINHWIHIHRVNMEALAALWFDRLYSGWWLSGVSWYAWRALRGFPWMGGRLFESLKSVSMRAHIHHSAYIELSVIQKGVTIAPRAIVSKSFIAEGATIMEGAQVTGSVIGEGAVVGRNAVVISSVVYPGALAAQFLMQGSLLGEEACALTNSAFFDINFNKNIRVAHRGRYVDIGSPYLGVCVGPRARVSAGVFVAHGREIPAGALLVKPPDEIANRIGEIRPDEPAAVSGGTVVSLNPDKTSG